MANFEKELENLLNRYSKENTSNTPDWILERFLSGCLASFNTAIQQRENWYGRDPRPTMITSDKNKGTTPQGGIDPHYEQAQVDRQT